MHLKDGELEWAETNPDLTFCFKQTVMIWAPCGFLWIFAVIDYMRRRNSRYHDIPWSLLNISKMLIVLLLLCATIFDLFMTISVHGHVVVYDVQFVSINVKIATFVSLLWISLTGIKITKTFKRFWC